MITKITKITVVVIILFLLLVVLYTLFWSPPKASREDCLKLLEIIKSRQPSLEPDTVDRQPEQQWDIFSNPSLHPNNAGKRNLTSSVTDSLLIGAYENIAKKMLENLVDIEESKLRWVFVRGYFDQKETRSSLWAHRDATTFTINIVLSDPGDYEGGEFLRLSSEESKSLKTNNLSNEILNNYVEEKFKRGRLTGVKPEMGTPVVLIGDRNNKGEVHAVRPVSKGQRYVLCAFFEGKVPKLLYQRSRGTKALFISV